MLCRGCQYDLSRSPPGPCPECGETDQDPLRLSNAAERWVLRICIVCSVWPLLICAWVHLAFVIARIQLGRWPGASGADDPTEIPGLFPLWACGIVAVMLAPFALIGALFCTISMAFSRPRLGLLGAAFTLGAIAMLIGMGDPAGAWAWFWD